MTHPAPDLTRFADEPAEWTPWKAWALAWLSRVAYAPLEHAETLCRRAGADTFAAIVRANVELIVVGVFGPTHPSTHVRSPGAVVIAYRGTDPLQLLDWIRNLTALTSADGPFDRGDRVHYGFWLDAHNVHEELWDSIPALGSVYLCGHSAGGARAQVAAGALINAGFRVRGVATYGAPRVGNGAFGRALENSVHWLVQHQIRGDIVTRVPHLGIPWRVWRGLHLPLIYRHAGRVEYLSRSGEWWTNPSWLSVFVDRWRCRQGWLSCLADRISDHSVLGYERALYQRWQGGVDALA